MTNLRHDAEGDGGGVVAFEKVIIGNAELYCGDCLPYY